MDPGLSYLLHAYTSSLINLISKLVKDETDDLLSAMPNSTDDGTAA